MSKAKGVRSGKSFVEVYLDKTKLMKGLKSAKQAMSNFADTIRKIGKVSLTAGLSLQALGTMAAKRFADLGDQIGKMSRRTGLASETLSELRYASDLSGTSMENLENSIRRMQRSIYDAGRGLSTATDALNDLNLTFKQLDGLSPGEQFRMIAKALSRVEDPSRKAAIAMSLLGRSGTQIIPLLDNFEELADEAQRLGLIMDADMTLRAEELTDAFSRLKMVTDMVIVNIGSALEPVIRNTTDAVRQIATHINEWVAENDKAIQSIYSLVPVLIAAGAALIAITNPLGAITAAVVAFGVKYGVTMDDVKNSTKTVTDALGELMNYLQDTFSVMTEALMAGDFIKAVKAFWIGVQIVWIEGVEKVKQVTAEIGISFLEMLESVSGGSSVALDAFSDILNGINRMRRGVLRFFEAWNEGWGRWDKADELYKERIQIPIDIDLSEETSLEKMTKKLKDAEEERQKAAAEGNKKRLKELNDQLDVLRKQISAQKKQKEQGIFNEGFGKENPFLRSIQETIDRAKAAKESFEIDQTRQTNETMSIFSSRLFDRLGLGTTTETPTERYMRETAKNTKDAAEALGG